MMRAHAASMLDVARRLHVTAPRTPKGMSGRVVLGPRGYVEGQPIAATPYKLGVFGAGAPNTSERTAPNTNASDRPKHQQNRGDAALLHGPRPPMLQASLARLRCAQKGRGIPKCFVSRRVRISLGC